MLPDCFDCKYGGLEHPCRTRAGAFDFAKVAASILAVGRAYASAMEQGLDPELGEDLDWVSDCEYETIEDHPQLLVPLIAAAIDMCESGRDAGYLAAGLIENALVKHGAQIITGLEDLAKGSARARYVLSGVWIQNDSIDAGVWKRLAATVASGPVISVDDPRNPGYGLAQALVPEEAAVAALFAKRTAG